QAALQVRLRVLGSETNRILQVLDGLAGLPFLVIDFSPVNISLGIFGFGLNCLRELNEGLLPVARLHIRLALGYVVRQRWGGRGVQIDWFLSRSGSCNHWLSRPPAAANQHECRQQKGNNEICRDPSRAKFDHLGATSWRMALWDSLLCGSL